MIDETDRRLKDWVGSILEGVEVSLSSPNGHKPGKGIGLYLLELNPKPPFRNSRKPPLQFLVRYLVTAWADQAEDAHRLLGELAFAAMENTEFETDLSPVWQAFGVAPQPSFILGIPVQKVRPEAEAPLVRTPLVVNSSVVTSFHGVVLGPGDVPISDARVAIPGLQLETRTDYKGRFRFALVPIEPAKKTLQVRAKGRVRSLITEESHPDDADPLLIRFNIVEE
jgi:Pvc16 N-terminal domain